MRTHFQLTLALGSLEHSSRLVVFDSMLAVLCLISFALRHYFERRHAVDIACTGQCAQDKSVRAPNEKEKISEVGAWLTITKMPILATRSETTVEG